MKTSIASCVSNGEEGEVYVDFTAFILLSEMYCAPAVPHVIEIIIVASVPDTSETVRLWPFQPSNHQLMGTWLTESSPASLGYVPS